MKKLYFIIAVLLLSGVSRSQTICDSCCSESFPYDFCDSLGNITTKCSTNPNSDTADGKPVKSFIPSCVIVDPMPANVIWQPIGPPPAPETLLSNSALGNDTNKEAGAAAQFSSDQISYPAAPTPPVEPTEPEDTCGDNPYPDELSVPTREDIWERFFTSGPAPYDSPFLVPPWDRPYDRDPDNWDDESEYDASCAQFALDSTNFLNGDPPGKIDETGFDGYAIEAVNWYFGVDERWLNDQLTHDEDSVADDETDEINWASCQTTYSTDSAAWPATHAQYVGEALQYSADSIAWVADSNDYVQVFNQDTAQSDAQKALSGWLNLCTPPIQPCPSSPPCCLHVVMDTNFRDFLPNPITYIGTTPYPGCKESTCPDRTILINISSVFLTKERGDDTGAAPSQYTLHPVSRSEYFTSSTTWPNSVTTGYYSLSFFQLMEHEIGHFLGLHHPEDPTTDGPAYSCHNCYTANPYTNPTSGEGFQTVMAQANNFADEAPLTLTNEDSCQFKKLYCNACGGGSGVVPCAYVDGVAAPEQDEFKAEIYPNPTTGECTLVYQVAGESFVQVAVYDMLGNPIRVVSSEYEGEGQHTISLGTESLPSGNYVCRVRVGGEVSYINLVIKK